MEFVQSRKMQSSTWREKHLRYVRIVYGRVKSTRSKNPKTQTYSPILTDGTKGERLNFIDGKMPP